MSSIRFFLVFSLFISIYSKNKQTFTLMLNPDGDAKDAGRMLPDSFERGVTLQFCSKLKKELENSIKNLRVVLTRFPGETIEYLQNANFSNRLNADLFLSIHFYTETEVLPNLYIYYFSNKPFYTNNPISLHFYTFDNAHLLNLSKTIKYAKQLRGFLKKNRNFKTKKEIGIPFKPLIGVTAPSLAIEAGIKNYDNLNIYLDPVFQAICKLIESNE